MPPFLLLAIFKHKAMYVLRWTKQHSDLRHFRPRAHRLEVERCTSRRVTQHDGAVRLKINVAGAVLSVRGFRRRRTTFVHLPSLPERVVRTGLSAAMADETWRRICSSSPEGADPHRPASKKLSLSACFDVRVDSGQFPWS